MGNEENDNQFLTWLDITKEPSDACKKIIKEEILEEISEKFIKEEILEEISEKFMEKILDMVNQNVQDALKKFQISRHQK
jgi:anaerobic ribonucleoside-triphosphate reductase